MTFQEFKDIYQKVPVVEHLNTVCKEPLVSVCVQTYQHVDFIRECLDGILMQKTDFPYEILLGEDASTDGTRGICVEYANKHPDRIRLFLHDRRNSIAVLGKATGRFNFLYNVFSARGRYIALCEGDDYWTDPLKLQKQSLFMRNDRSIAMCVHDVEIVYEGGVSKRSPFRKCLIPDKLDFNFVLRNHVVPTPSIFFRRDLFKNIPDWFTNVLSGDRALVLLIVSKGDCLYLGEKMAIKRKNPSGITQSGDYHDKDRMILNKLYLYKGIWRETRGYRKSLMFYYFLKYVAKYSYYQLISIGASSR